MKRFYILLAKYYEKLLILLGDKQNNPIPGVVIVSSYKCVSHQRVLTNPQNITKIFVRVYLMVWYLRL